MRITPRSLVIKSGDDKENLPGRRENRGLGGGAHLGRRPVKHHDWCGCMACLRRAIFVSIVSFLVK